MEEEPVWHIKFYGVRGSTPVCETGFQKFGGNTSCIYADLLTNDLNKTIAIFDAGTGIRKLGKEISEGALPDTDTIYLLFTHFHWDHIQGLPFFEPAYMPTKKLKIFSPHHEMQEKQLKHIFEVQMQEEYFPVQLDRMGAKFQFITEKDYKMQLSSESYITFDYRLHNHPGGAFSYRFSAKGKTVVLCTDLEHGKEIDMEVVRFCEGADLLIHDAQYTDEELIIHRGWGHSSYSQAIEVAKLAKVKQLVFTHHDPDHNDDFLEKKERECQMIFPNCKIAREGLAIFV
jgi:phosphoribosyl 1,2-cyclic phosphodiesterase